MIYLYAISDQPGKRLPAMCGLEEAAVTKVPYRDLAAVASHVTTAEVPALEANLWRHEMVVEGVMADRTVLPVRFGTIFGSERAIQAELRAHYASFVADLNRMRGHVEMGVRVLRSNEDGSSPPPSMGRPAGNESSEPRLAYASGRAYLLTRLEEERQLRAAREQAESLAAELHAPLARLAAQSTCQMLITPRLLLTAAYLLDRNGVAAFRREVEVLSTAYEQLGFLCTGPWPPYSFVTAAVPSGRGEAEECSQLIRNS